MSSTTDISCDIIVNMNKDVIYIEPEDDITIIINKITSAKEKIVAIVPSQNTSALNSTINIRLVAKAAKEAKKTAVIISKDSALVKLAAVAGLPVADSLQSRPKMPADIDTSTQESDQNSATQSDSKPDASADEPAQTNTTSQIADVELSSIDITDSASESAEDGREEAVKKIPSFDRYRKWIIVGILAALLIIGGLVWAFVFAPAAKIAISIRTTANNFSENISFVTKVGTDNSKDGVFLLDKQVYKQESSVEFKATGSKDVGEKARGNLYVSFYTKTDNIAIPKGAKFSYGENTYVADEGAAVMAPGDPIKDCENNDTTLIIYGCLRTAKFSATAAESGPVYNIGAHSVGWSTTDLAVQPAKIYNSEAFTGGTSKVITVVQQSDIDAAKEKLSNDNSTDGKSRLMEQFGQGVLVIDSSFKKENTDPIATPALGEEVDSKTTPKITASTTYTAYGVEKNALEDFIKNKASATLPADQKIYDTGNPFIERFVEDGTNIVAKLKTSIQTGPKVTEQDILEKSQGRKIGEVQSLIKSINGVSSVKINTSYFWVNKVPDDANKITIELKVEE